MREANNEVIEKRINILLEAIKDTQGIIGRLDTKARFYLTIYLAIFGGNFAFLVKVMQIEKNIFCWLGLIIGFIVVGLVVWLIYQIFTKIISPRSNPIESIENLPNDLKSTIFYPISYCFEGFLNKLNNIQSLEDIEKILSVELLKLSVIRDKKTQGLGKIEKFNRLLVGLIFAEFVFLFFGSITDLANWTLQCLKSLYNTLS